MSDCDCPTFPACEASIAFDFFDMATGNLYDWYHDEEKAKSEVRSMIESGESIDDLVVSELVDGRHIGRSYLGRGLHDWLAGLHDERVKP